jgi:hypothetical protein
MGKRFSLLQNDMKFNKPKILELMIWGSEE